MPTYRSLSIALIAATSLAALAACSSSGSSHGRSAAPPEPARPAQGVQTVDVSGAPSAASARTASASADALPDACALLTKAEAEKLAGVHMQAPDDTVARDPATDIGSCTYDAVVTGPSGQVSVFVQHGMPHALGVDRAIHHKFRTVPGIADQTLEEPENQSIFIRKGQTWIYVEASNTTAATLERAARLVAARLP
jgi:hypothetical protein